MILTGKEIQKQVEQGTIQIDPFEPSRLNPNSYNVRLDSVLLRYQNVELDVKRDEPVIGMEIGEEGILLHPFEFYLGNTMEIAGSGKYIPMLEGRSSLARMGLGIHITAGFGDVGFVGSWTLEIFCLKPIRIYAGMEIGQVFFVEAKGEVDLYRGKYNGFATARKSQIFKEFKK